jgi:hypothetical protein
MELPLEGFILCLVEITQHDCPGKNFGLVDTEGLSMRLPRDNIPRVTVGHVFKQGVELDRKRKLDKKVDLEKKPMR